MAVEARASIDVRVTHGSIVPSALGGSGSCQSDNSKNQTNYKAVPHNSSESFPQLHPPKQKTILQKATDPAKHDVYIDVKRFHN